MRRRTLEPGCGWAAGMLDAEIGDLFADPGVQKSGIGRQLVAHALRLHSTATLDVFELNSTARAFYARPTL
ncbi:GNAT family N-acetyltransferase [Nocardia sp. NPDC059228]|uniref:GNAT family N-acetyltransferase n=1 Tax=Nocardia sp. NPDC059228 TaxID=3346777 RepID=UPI0036AA613C